jgi:hypothetical protein
VTSPMPDYFFDRPVSDWHAKPRRLYEHWLGMHPQPGALPSRRDFDPAAVPDLLPLLWMLDVHRNPLRFRYRLVGTAHATAMQRELTGKWMHEANPEFLTAPRIYQHYVDVVTKREPRYRKGRARYGVDPHLYEMERVLLPLAENGEEVDMILALTVYYRRDGTEAWQESQGLAGLGGGDAA